MLIPLGTDVRPRRPTLITYVIMAVCVVVFVGQSVAENRAGENGVTVFDRFVLYATPTSEAEVEAYREWERASNAQGEPARFNPPRWYQFVTYQFLHADWLHLIGNMVFLLVFGPPVEDRLRRWGFVVFYLGAGALAGLAHGLMETEVRAIPPGLEVILTPSVVGASGSIAAVTGAYLVLFPRAPVKVLLFFFLIGRYALPGWVFVLFSVAYDLLFVAFGDRGVAHFAHLGGYVAGAGVAMLLLWRRVLKPETYDLFSILKQAHRRRQYRELVSKGPARSPFVRDAAEHQRVPERVRARAAEAEESLAEEKREIAALARTDAPGAAERYLALVRTRGDVALPRDAQLAIANALYQRGDHEEAASAYEAFLKRFASDREADQTRLMLAMVCARKLNDPVRATTLLREIDRDSLSEDLRSLHDTLVEELA